MIAVYIHNPHDKGCRDLLPLVRRAFPRLEVYDFMSIRHLVRIQGTPSIWLFRDDQNPLIDEPVYRQDVEVDLATAIAEYQRLEGEEEDNPELPENPVE